MNRYRNQLQVFWRFLRYFWQAKTIYDIHSPFVVELVNIMLEDKRFFYAFSEIELLREQLLRDKRQLRIEDHGAGSNVNTQDKRTVSDLARHAAISPSVGRMLFRLVNFCNPNNILELGTSLGISTLYLRAAALNAKIITIEGCPDIAAQAQANFERMRAKNIELCMGTFQAQLLSTLQNLQKLDFLYLDGDHREEASLNYFNQCLDYADEESVFVIADIYWSDGMQSAWQQMCQHPKISLSIDLFYLGILFFRKENRESEHFTLIPKRYKPWRIGLFSR